MADGFTPVQTGSQKQICSAFNGSVIISGTFIPTGSNEKMKVYPERVTEDLLANMPTRTRGVNRIASDKQMQANTFENQVTMKRGDLDSEHHEMISVLDPSARESEKYGSHPREGAVF